MADPQTVVARITDEPIDVADAIARVADVRAGGIGVFVGTVRSTPSEESDADVVRLEYEAHPVLAPQRIDEIAREAQSRWSLEHIVAVHRTGICGLGDVTVVVACSAAHRAEALDACRWCIDTIKATVPIWKKEVYTDGHAWVGAQHSESSA
ncbi:MAG: molybdenum cofactor biosynthesis protein MoaE [Actinomycetota bacterium]